MLHCTVTGGHFPCRRWHWCPIENVARNAMRPLAVSTRILACTDAQCRRASFIALTRNVSAHYSLRRFAVSASIIRCASTRVSAHPVSARILFLRRCTALGHILPLHLWSVHSAGAHFCVGVVPCYMVRHCTASDPTFRCDNGRCAAPSGIFRGADAQSAKPAHILPSVGVQPAAPVRILRCINAAQHPAQCQRASFVAPATIHGGVA